MDINWLETILYGIVSGLTEFMPVSSQAHQVMLRSLLGLDGVSHLLNLFIHIGMLAGLFIGFGNTISELYRQYKLGSGGRRRRKRNPDLQALYDIQFVRAAIIPLLIGFFVYPTARKWTDTVPWTVVFLLLNGIILHVPMYLARGNKDSRSMTAIDGTLFGFASALSILPGISRIGVGSSFSVSRGADPQHAFKWSLLLSIPALIGWIGFDLYGIVSVGLAGADIVFLLQCMLGCGTALVGAVLSVKLVMAIVQNNGFVNFSYYCWGAALFIFILYLY